jgi:hypothetical protein
VGLNLLWTNKQINPVMVNLDRILVSTDWEARFPKCFAWSKTRVGSDHWLILLDTGENSSCGQKVFYFENNGNWRKISLRNLFQIGTR